MGLKPADFLIEEDGRFETLSRLSEPGCSPIDLALLIDLTDSIKPRFDFEIQAAARFVSKLLRPEDSVTIVSIGSQPGLLLARTGDIGMVLRSLLALSPTEGTTAFFDSLAMAAGLLRKNSSPDSRRVILALSDGEDNHSDLFDLTGSIREIQAADCAFYSINPSGPSISLNKVSLEAQEAMLTLAAQTGGTASQPGEAGELEVFFDTVAANLREQYLLEYYSSSQSLTAAYHRIEVRSPTHPELRIRARKGYFSLGS
jgi:Ca-activated chloride channel homolog